MSEWTIDITSIPGSLPQGADPGDVLEQLAGALESSPAALGPAVSADTAAGTVSSTYQVEAQSFFDAMHVGQSVFIQALLFAGLAPAIGEYEQRPADPAAA